ncbi:MAG: MXAN_6640 family putative metalloprotease, partial [Actinomycetes bacterium]
GASGASAEVDAAPAPTETQIAETVAAEQALDVAHEVLAGSTSELSPSLALRELALRQTDLSGADRLAAEALLTRPNGGAIRSDFSAAVWTSNEAAKSATGGGCSSTVPVCVHWTNRTSDAPPSRDDNNNQVPDWVEVTVDEMETVWDYEVNTLGYRRPLTDERASIDNDGVNFDVYLSDIGSRGLYGYCTLDDSRTKTGYRFGDYASYCVLDNDFARSEFPTNTPRENLQVTAAHEFFHAVQFAYDAFEDIWFMESSAAWMEEVVFDAVNDNRQYLRSSQFRMPKVPLDASRGLGVYGSWGFLQYLTERFDTDLIKKAWNRADYSPGGPDDHSIQALDRVISKQTNFGNVMGDFGLALNEPKAFLSEGAQFPSAAADRFRLARAGASTGWQSYTLDHMSYAPVEVRPGSSVKASSRLKVIFDAPGRATAPEARVMVVRKNGSTDASKAVQLNRKGKGSVSVPFAPGSVRRVVVAMGNTSTDFRRCYSYQTKFSCGGAIPLHDNTRHWFKAIVR